MYSTSSVAMSSSILLTNSKMVSYPLVLQEGAVVIKAVDDAPNLIMLYVLVVLTYTAAGTSGNGISSMLVMALVVELIDYYQRNSLLLQSVETMEYPHQLFF